MRRPNQFRSWRPVSCYQPFECAGVVSWTKKLEGLEVLQPWWDYWKHLSAKNIGGCFDEVLVVANFFSKLDLPTDGISAMHWPHVASQLAFLFFCRVIRCVVFWPFLVRWIPFCFAPPSSAVMKGCFNPGWGLLKPTKVMFNAHTDHLSLRQGAPESGLHRDHLAAV